MKRLLSIIAAFCILLAPFAAQATTYTYGLTFTSGGTHEVIVGDTLTGGTGGATGVVTAITISGGTWGGGNAAGAFILSDKTGTFESENLNEGANSNVCTIGGTAATVAQDWSSPSKGVSLTTFTITGEGNGGAIPATVTASDINAYVFMVESNPGSTAPTASWDYTFDSEDSGDILGGEGANRSATTTERISPKVGSAYPGSSFVDGTGTLTVTGNSVNSAGIVVKVYVRRQP